MNTLSPEILALIVDAVRKQVRVNHEPRGLSRFASISRLWQLLVEEQLFETIIIADTEVGSFAKIFGGRFKVARRHSLRRLIFKPNSKSPLPLGDSLSQLLAILRCWETDGRENHPGLKLCLCLRDRQRHFQVKDGLTVLYCDQPLPVTAIVTELRSHDNWEETSWVEGRRGFALHHKATAKLLSALPNLERLQLWLPNANNMHLHVDRYRVSRASDYTSLTRILDSLDLSNLVYLQLRSSQPGVLNHNVRPDGVVDPQSQRGDIFSATLGRLASRQLRELHIQGLFTISQALFEPHGKEHGQDAEGWPIIRRLVVECGIFTPSGGWYLTGDPSNEDADRDYWRHVPDPDSYDPLVRAATRALRCMPKLERFELHLSAEPDGNRSPPDKFAGFDCLDAGERYWTFCEKTEKFRSETTTSRMCRYHAGPRRWERRWDAPPDVRELWSQWTGNADAVVREFHRSRKYSFRGDGSYYMWTLAHPG